MGETIYIGGNKDVIKIKIKAGSTFDAIRAMKDLILVLEDGMLGEAEPFVIDRYDVKAELTKREKK